MINRRTFPQRLRWRPTWRIEDAPLLFVDLETTGLYPERGHRIWEAAIFDTGGLRFHGGGTSDGKELTEFEEATIIRAVAEAIGHKIVVGHNIPFDLRFLAERCRRLDITVPSVGFVDTLGMARRHLDDPDEELTLEYVAAQLGLVVPDELHRAVPDTRLARDIFRAMVADQHLDTLEEVRVRRFESHDH